MQESNTMKWLLIDAINGELLVEEFCTLEKAQRKLLQELSQTVNVPVSQLRSGDSRYELAMDHREATVSTDDNQCRWLIYEISGIQSEVITPLGSILTRTKENTDYPGFWIDFKSETGRVVPIVCVEYDPNDGNNGAIAADVYDSFQIGTVEDRSYFYGLELLNKKNEEEFSNE